METLLPFEKIKRTILVRKDAETSDKFGINPEHIPTEQLVNYGIVNIDKPAGPSSHQISAYVQSILGINKSGHSGTLDPKVTGCLPVAIGRATRVVQTLLTAGKEYVCLMHLHQDVDEGKLRGIMERFTGRIKQLPPVKSAVKRQHRFRNIYYIEILDRVEKDVLFRAGCQAGTYIRKLVHDMGQGLGCGAHMAELRRTKAGPFNEDTLCTLQELTDAFYYYKEEGNDKYLRHLIKPVEFAVQHLPKVYVLDTTVESLCHGAMLAVPGISKVDTEIQKDETVAVMTLKKELICLGTARMISKQMAAEKSGIAVKTEKVFMHPGTYPRVEKKE
ncbi:RNA-guided pseudouridylation complex pseudouridine synthase subunit Cbf5 [Candidatus Woesearchaeota archaeon]|nr:RNA-guided pseudouridylation complex pseudouridine synthase subunit Cbf5 [Candidatus Woesearchaeota archaeon]